MNRIPNNNNRIANRIRNANIEHIVSIVTDDGAIIVNVENNLTSPELQHLVSTVQSLAPENLIGDGVQANGIMIFDLQGNLVGELI